MIQYVEKIATTNSSGVATIFINLNSPMRVFQVDWIKGTLATGVDATLVAVGNGAQIVDRTLLTLTDANADSFNAISESGNGLVTQQLKMSITSGGNAGIGGMRVWLDDTPISSGGSVTVAPPAAIYNGKKTVTTHGTRVPLAASQALLTGVTVKALASNTGAIFVGDASVSITGGYQLAAGDSCFIEIANLATIYIDAAVDGEGVTYSGT